MPNCLTYLRAAQAIAKAMKLFDTGDGLLVTKSIAPPKDLGDGVVARPALGLVEQEYARHPCFQTLSAALRMSSTASSMPQSS